MQIEDWMMTMKMMDTAAVGECIPEGGEEMANHRVGIPQRLNIFHCEFAISIDLAPYTCTRCTE